MEIKPRAQLGEFGFEIYRRLSNGQEYWLKPFGHSYDWRNHPFYYGTEREAEEICLNYMRERYGRVGDFGWELSRQYAVNTELATLVELL